MFGRPLISVPSVLSAVSLVAMAFLAPAASGADLTQAFDKKHKECLERIAEDSDLAYEEAMIWRSHGGGRRAKHCEAMALFALGHEDEAAHRLDELAKASDGGSPEMRADFYSEAANFWLIANAPDNAYASASAGLELKKDHTDLRIARARAYSLKGRYDYAETDLTSALVFDPESAAAFRYRADARMEQDKLDEALEDIETSLSLNPESVETALLRGRIREALRKQNETQDEADDTTETDSETK